MIDIYAIIAIIAMIGLVVWLMTRDTGISSYEIRRRQQLFQAQIRLTISDASMRKMLEEYHEWVLANGRRCIDREDQIVYECQVQYDNLEMGFEAMRWIRDDLKDSISRVTYV